ncbi:hypothetical protein [Cryobacterium sp. TMT2-4]|uniref:hypothetical protein n=1 Tax=Cryobacterium sp. TMT2-4 TaxID=1259254 RepID=UPI00106D4272|nr:hypothetical protein [Cryobacterium sp. TMT2-4]TFC63818.1 hypothetical protein E3O54_15880 [Cryobacterium sp. TMT2-4]
MTTITPRPRVLVIATARPTFVIEVAETRARAARALLESLGAEVHGPLGLVMSADDLEAARAHLDRDFDLIINVCASFSDASPALALYAGLEQPVLLWSFREPGHVGDRLWLNSLCGSNLYAHALVRAGGSVRLLYGDPDEVAIADALSRALSGDLPSAATLPSMVRERSEPESVRKALDSLRGKTLGLVSEAPPGFTPSEYDGDLLQSLFGLTVHKLSIDEMFSRIDDVSSEACGSEERAVRAARPSLATLDPEEVSRHAAVTVALRDWTATQALSALAIRCWPEFPSQRGVCPCSSMSRIADEATPTACERDVYGAVTMLLMEALGSGTTYLVDTVDLDAQNNSVRLWHCGSAATSLAADPEEATQFVHCNRKIGVAGNFPLRTGPVIMARLTENITDAGVDGLRLLIAAGESIPAPNRFQGNTAEVRLDVDASAFVNSLVVGGFPHHTVLAWQDIRPQLRAAADLMGIPVTEW